MSLSSTIDSSQVSTSSLANKNYIFNDPPIISSNVKLNIFELDKTDKQIVNELVYRCCRILTRVKNSEPPCRVLIIDTIASMNPIRLAMILKRDTARLRQIQIARQCKINSTYVTLCALLKPDDKPGPLTPKLCVIYHDEFYVMKTLNLLKEVMNSSPKTQFILVISRLDRLSRDALNLMPNNQILHCDFEVNRKDIAPAPPEMQSESYQKYLNHVIFRKQSKTNGRYNTSEAELTEEGLHLFNVIPSRSEQAIKSASDVTDGFQKPSKRHKTSQDDQ